MPKKIHINALSSKSLSLAIKEIEKYREDLRDKNDEFVQKLCELGLPVVRDYASAASGDSSRNYNSYIKLNSYGMYSKAELIWEGKDVLFIEFGAGVHYNGEAGTSPHLMGKELGYVIGSYGQGYGKQDFWYYEDGTGAHVRSYGTEGTMPMYRASLKIQEQIVKIAKEVFG